MRDVTLPEESVQPDDDPQTIGRTRHIGRATMEYFIDTVALTLRLSPSELLPAVIWLAILDANVRHVLDDEHPEGDYAQFAPPVPDERRRPVSRSAISNRLGVPFETCRRQIKRLLAADLCAEVKGGLIITAEQLENPQVTKVGQDGLVNLRQLMRRLAIEPDF